MLFIKSMKNASVFALIASLITLFSACDKVPFLKNSSDGGAENRGIVQTDWKKNEAAGRSSIAQPEKSGDGMVKQPVILADSPADSKSARKASSAILSKNNSAEFSVQIGAFLVADNATRLIKKLRRKGYDPSLTVVTTPAKKWNMVRIGAYADQKSAVAAARKFTSKEKMETAVVKDRTIVDVENKIDASQPAKQDVGRSRREMPTMVAKFHPERFSFQVGGLRSRSNAEKYQLLLKKKGYKPVIKQVKSRGNNETWYSVQIGIYDNIDLAAEAAAAFTAKERIPARAVSIGN